MINARTDTVVATIPVGRGAFGEAVDAEADTVYVTNVCDNTISVISGRTDNVLATIPVGGQPRGVAVDNRTGDAYVSDFADGTMSGLPLTQRPSDAP